MRYSLKDMLNKTTSGNSKFVLKEKISYKFISGKEKNIIRFLPAFDNDKKGSEEYETSWLPSINEDGEINPFIMPIMVARGLGHGTNSAAKKSILSLSTFGEQCPLEVLFTTAKENPEDWGYLIAYFHDSRTGQWKKDSEKFADLSAPGAMMLANGINIADDHGVQIIILPKSAMNSLVGNAGLVFQRNTSPNITEEQLAEDYFLGYANGDITDPQHGPCVLIEKGVDKGSMSDYTAKVAMSGRNVKRQALTEENLKSRYNLEDPEEILDIKNEDEIIEMLTEIYNGHSPQGVHESALIQEAFPYRDITKPVTKTTVQVDKKLENPAEEKEEQATTQPKKVSKKSDKTGDALKEAVKNSTSEDNPDTRAEASSEKVEEKEAKDVKVPGDNMLNKELLEVLKSSGLDISSLGLGE